MTRLGPFALAHNGNLVNAAELRERIDDGQVEFTSTTDSELIAFAFSRLLIVGSTGRPPSRLRCRSAGVHSVW